MNSAHPLYTPQNRSYTPDMWGIKRNLEQKATELLDMFPGIVILGARQSGKTTLVKNLKPNWKYIDLEKPSDFDLITQDIEFFFSQYSEGVIIDEAQIEPGIFKVLRGIIDEKRNLRGRFIITGSSSPDLLRESSETLAGRVAILELGTLKANELYERPLSPFYSIFESKLSIDHFKEIISTVIPLTTKEMQHSWIKGGYPEPVLDLDEKFYKNWMEAYRNTYINRDIAKLFPKLNRINYRRFITLLCKLSGTILNKRDIARAIEMDEKTVADYLSIAEGTFIWRSLPSFEGNPMKSIVKMPKGHIRDTGLMHYLLNINTFDDLFASTFLGDSFEAFVVEEIIKGLEAKEVVNWFPYYYRTRDGAEIDLILEGPFGYLPIEIKFGIHHTMKQLSSLRKFIEEMQLPFGIIIDQSKSIEWLTDKIVRLPVGYL